MPSSRLRPISSASAAVMTLARTAAASTKSGWPHGSAGPAGELSRSRRRDAQAALAQACFCPARHAAQHSRDASGTRSRSSRSRARSAARNPVRMSACRSSVSPRQPADREAAARRSPGIATPARPTTHAGSPPRARRTSSAQTLFRPAGLVAGCSSRARSSPSGISRFGSPAARRPGLTASGRGPVVSVRNAASAASSGPDPPPRAGPTARTGDLAAPGQVRAGSSWRMRAPRRERACSRAPRKPAVMDLPSTSDRPRAAFSPTRHAPGDDLPRAGCRQAARPARRASASRSTWQVHGSYAAGSRQVHRRYTGCGSVAGAAAIRRIAEALGERDGASSS